MNKAQLQLFIKKNIIKKDGKKRNKLYNILLFGQFNHNLSLISNTNN